MNPFVERHQDKIAGVLSCFDRVIITGTLPDICYAGAMASYLSYHKIRLFDFPRWAEPYGMHCANMPSNSLSRPI